MKANPQEQFSEWLEEDEIISYSEFFPRKTLPFLFYKILFFVFIVSFFLIISAHYIFFMFFLGIIGVSTYNHLKGNTGWETHFETYAITNKRIIILDDNHNLTSINHSDIYNLIINEEGLSIMVNPFTDRSALTLGSNQSIPRLKNHISKYLEEQSPYALLNNTIEQFSKKYNLLFTPFDFGKRRTLSLSGRIHNYRFSFKMKYMHNFEKITVTLNCSNEENNYLLIHPEKTADSIAKLIGMQDYKIGIDWFDYNFILQGNNEHFIHNILNEEIALEINNAMTHLKGEIKMGIKKEMKPEEDKNNNIDEDITLDAHLIQEGKKEEIIRIPNHTSELIYTSTDLMYNENFQELAEDIVKNLEMLVLIAGRINAYDGK